MSLRKLMLMALVVAALSVGTVFAQKPGGGSGFKLPTEVGKTVTIEIPGLAAGARKLELVLVPGLGGVQPFFLGMYEVTQGQYEAVMHTNRSTFKKGPDYPVEQLSWQDSKDFCARLATVLPPELKTKVRFRLPTDEEWSIAVGLPEERGRTPAEKSGRIKNVFPWGT